MKVPWLPLIFILISPVVFSQTQAMREEELRQAIDVIETRYAYMRFNKEQISSLRRKYLKEAERPLDNRQYVALLERLLDEFHDNHLQLNTNIGDSYRLVPSQSSFLAEWQGSSAIIYGVSPSVAREATAIRVGSEILEVNGKPIEKAVSERLEHHLDQTSPFAKHWALNSVISGRRDRPVLLRTIYHGNVSLREIPTPVSSGNSRDLINCRLNSDAYYVRFEDSLGRTSTIDSFRQLLPAMEQSKAVVIDLRNTPSGGNSLVARGILGHFVSQERPYQMHELPQEASDYGIPRRWLELVSPLAPKISAPVTVLVGPWTGSMGEGLAIGFDATRSAIVMGRPMAQLRGATSCISLPSLGSSACINLPTERLFHVSGAPRESFRPAQQEPASLVESHDVCGG